MKKILLKVWIIFTIIFFTLLLINYIEIMNNMLTPNYEHSQFNIIVNFIEYADKILYK